MSTFISMNSILPEGQIGNAAVEHFEVSEADSRFSALRSGEYVPSGKYARLKINGKLWMSDTPMERRTNYEFVHRATGGVLITGLGLGYAILPAIRKPEVLRMVVVEKYADVVSLVLPHLRDHLGPAASKLEVILADAYSFDGYNGEKFNVIYHDIWAEQSTDDLESMTRLKRHFRRYMAKGCFQSCWREDYLRYAKRSGGWR